MNTRKPILFVLLLGCAGFVSGMLSYLPLSSLRNFLGSSTFYWWPGLVLGIALSLFFWKAGTSIFAYLKLASWLAVSTASYYSAVWVTLRFSDSFVTPFPSLQAGELAVPLILGGAVGSLGMLFGFGSLLLKISLPKTAALTILGSFLGLSFYVGNYIYILWQTEVEFSQNVFTLYIIWQAGMSLAIGIATYAHRTQQIEELAEGAQKRPFANKFANVFILVLVLLVALALGAHHDKSLQEAENLQLEETKKVAIQEDQKRLRIERQEAIETFRKIPYTVQKAEYIPSGYVPSSYSIRYDFPMVTMYIKKADTKPLSFYHFQGDFYKNVWAQLDQTKTADTACVAFENLSPYPPFVYEPSPCLPFLKTNKGFQLYRSDGYSFFAGRKKTVSTITTKIGGTAFSFRVFNSPDATLIQEVVKIVDSFAPMNIDELIAQYNIED